MNELPLCPYYKQDYLMLRCLWLKCVECMNRIHSEENLTDGILTVKRENQPNAHLNLFFVDPVLYSPAIFPD